MYSKIASLKKQSDTLKFILILLLFGLSIFQPAAKAQQQDSVRLLVVNQRTNKASGVLHQGIKLKVKTFDGEKFSGKLQLKGDSFLFIGEKTIPINEIASFYSPVWVYLTMTTLVPVVVFPPIIQAAIIAFIIEESYAFNSKKERIVIETTVSRKKRNEQRLQQNKQDSIMLFSRHTYNNFLNPKADSVFFGVKSHRSDPPDQFLFLGTDVEKLFVPAFSFSVDYFFLKHWGLHFMTAYKPLNPDGSVEYMSWTTNPDYFCRNNVFRLGAMYTYKDRKAKYYFVGPEIYYKTMHVDDARVCTTNNGSGDRHYSRYWRDKTVYGFGIKVGSIPFRRLGLGWSFGIGLRKSEYTDYIISPIGDAEFDSETSIYPTIDASITLKFKIRKKKSSTD